MNDFEEEQRQAVALFRYGLIADPPPLAPGGRRIGAKLREKAARTHAIPGTRRTRVAVETMRGWLKLYRRGGFEALHPKRRGDLGRPRRLPAETAEALVGIKTGHPGHSVRQVIAHARKHGRAPESARLAKSTVYRLLKREGPAGRLAADPPAADRRRFAHRHAGELWMLCERSHSIQYGNPIVMGT